MYDGIQHWTGHSFLPVPEESLGALVFLIMYSFVAEVLSSDGLDFCSGLSDECNYIFIHSNLYVSSNNIN